MDPGKLIYVLSIGIVIYSPSYLKYSSSAIVTGSAGTKAKKITKALKIGNTKNDRIDFVISKFRVFMMKFFSAISKEINFLVNIHCYAQVKSGIRRCQSVTC